MGKQKKSWVKYKFFIRQYSSKIPPFPNGFSTDFNGQYLQISIVDLVILNVKPLARIGPSAKSMNLAQLNQEKIEIHRFFTELRRS
jgi:hypothetical protein